MTPLAWAFLGCVLWEGTKECPTVSLVGHTVVAKLRVQSNDHDASSSGFAGYSWEVPSSSQLLIEKIDESFSDSLGAGTLTSKFVALAAGHASLELVWAGGAPVPIHPYTFTCEFNIKDDTPPVVDTGDTSDTGDSADPEDSSDTSDSGDSGTVVEDSVVSLWGDAVWQETGSSVAFLAGTSEADLGQVLVGGREGGSGTYGDGAVYLVVGSAVATGSFTLSSVGTPFVGTGGLGFGGSITVAGDVDDDGYADLVIGAPGVGGKALMRGGAYLFHGPLDASSYTPTAASGYWMGNEDDRAGLAIASIDQGNPDEHARLGIGAPGAYSGAGVLYVVDSAVSGLFYLSSSSGVYTGNNGSGMGTSVASGDLNGDGSPELLTGAPNNNGTGTVYALDGLLLVQDDDPLLSPTVVLNGEGGQFGTSLTMGDLDGDGLPELAVGAPSQSFGGSVYVFQSPISGTVSVGSASKVTTDHHGADFGQSLAVAAEGLVVGSPYYDDDSGEVGSASGMAFLVPEFGSTEEGIETIGMQLLAPGYAHAGESVAARDMDLDGESEIVIGATYAENGGTASGGAFLLWSGVK